MSVKKRVLFSIAAGAAVLALASLPLPGADYAILPGQLLAGLFWPEGIHSGGGGIGVAGAFVFVAWIGTLLLWSALFFMVAALVHKSRVA